MITFPFLRPQPLHIPDGMLSMYVSIACWAISAAVLAVAIRRSGRQLGERQVPLMGVMAAFIFAAQMLNFPVAGGTSGHLLGGVLAAVALGPWAGMLVMTSVVVVQALLFQDGGLVVMGANILNMGILTVIVGYGMYRVAAGRATKTRLITAGVAAWLSVIAAALSTALQLWLSGAARLDIVVPAMLSVHVLIGLGEALITVAALSFILRVRPDIIDSDAALSTGKGWILAGILIVAAVLILSPLAVAEPDGLERVAMDLGFFNEDQQAPFEILPDYTLPFLGETPLSTILAGSAGVVVLLTLFALLRLVKNKPERPGENLSE
jgi:cobalt/nickel transport system permease protein